jgi:ubiquinol-cytochrome c reductase cytochrome c subunit
VQDHGVARDQLVDEGETLFLDACSSCHGEDARGIAGRGPSLRGVGEASADFYLRTGRMPLRDPEDQPRRSESPFSERQADALIAYVGTFGGPPVPAVDAAAGDLAEGFRLFGEHCMGCHQVVGQGGITTTGVAPDLQSSEPIDVAEALVVAPYVMPDFEHLTQDEVDSLAAYVEYTEDPQDVGGWGIGHLGPIPEGMVAWLLAGFALLLVIRVIGERTTE